MARSSGHGSFAEGLDGPPPYAISKAALNALTVTLARGAHGDATGITRPRGLLPRIGPRGNGSTRAEVAGSMTVHGIERRSAST